MRVAGIRDRALLLFGFSSGGRRRSEVSSARLEHLIPADGGAYVYRLPHSKTDQAGTEHNPDAAKAIAGRPRRP